MSQKHGSFPGPDRDRDIGPATLAALASVRVEGCLALEADVGRGQADDLRPSAPGEDERQEQRPIPTTGDRVRHHGEQAANLVGAQASGDRLDRLRSLERIARVAGQDVHPDQEPVVRGEAGDPGPTVADDGSRPEAPIPWAQAKA